MSDEALLERATCSALVITCSDFRIKSAEHALVDAAGLRDDYDLIARPGAIRSLVLPRNAAAGASMEEGDPVVVEAAHVHPRVDGEPPELPCLR